MKFKEKVEDFLKRTGMSPSTLGRLALNDSSFVLTMRGYRGQKPRSPTLDTVDRVEEFMDNYVPAGQAA